MITLVFVLFGALAHAHSLLDRYMVTDVASGHFLNIRAAATASTGGIGELFPYILNVEFLRESIARNGYIV